MHVPSSGDETCAERNSSASDKRESSLYKCSICNRNFEQFKCLLKHEKIHVPDKNKSYKCKKCSRSFIYHSSLEHHLRQNHYMELKGCSETPGDLKENEGKKKAYLEISAGPFGSQKSLEPHLRKTDQSFSEEYECCNDLDEHSSKIHASKKYYPEVNRHQVDKYLKSFQEKSMPRKKIALIGDEWTGRCFNTSRKEYQCLQCGTSSLSIQALVTHSAKHNLCDICGESFLLSSMCDQHKRMVHSADKPSQYCHICSQLFKTSDDLNQHMSVHTEKKSPKPRKRTIKRRHTDDIDRPYKCFTCSKSFSGMGRYLQHVRSHTRAMPYKCDICGRTFALPGTLASHRRMHTGESSFLCTHCQERFVTSQELIEHCMQAHTQHETSLVCLDCGVTYRPSNELVGHLMTHSSQIAHLHCAECTCVAPEKTDNTWIKHIVNDAGETLLSCGCCSNFDLNDLLLLENIEKHIEADKENKNDSGKIDMNAEDLSPLNSGAKSSLNCTPDDREPVEDGDEPETVEPGDTDCTLEHNQLNFVEQSEIYGMFELRRPDMVEHRDSDGMLGLAEPDSLENWDSDGLLGLTEPEAFKDSDYIEDEPDSFVIKQHRGLAGDEGDGPDTPKDMPGVVECADSDDNNIPAKHQKTVTDDMLDLSMGEHVNCEDLAPEAYTLLPSCDKQESSCQSEEGESTDTASESGDQESLDLFCPRNHLKTHYNENQKHKNKINMYLSQQSQYKCSHCSKEFKTQHHLGIHKRIKHRMKKPHTLSKKTRDSLWTENTTCVICGEMFEDASVFEDHIQWHAGEKPYKCNICNHCFTRACTLDSHMKTHDSSQTGGEVGSDPEEEAPSDGSDHENKTRRKNAHPVKRISRDALCGSQAFMSVEKRKAGRQDKWDVDMVPVKNRNKSLLSGELVPGVSPQIKMGCSYFTCDTIKDRRKNQVQTEASGHSRYQGSGVTEPECLRIPAPISVERNEQHINQMRHHSQEEFSLTCSESDLESENGSNMRDHNNNEDVSCSENVKNESVTEPPGGGAGVSQMKEYESASLKTWGIPFTLKVEKLDKADWDKNSETSIHLGKVNMVTYITLKQEETLNNSRKSCLCDDNYDAQSPDESFTNEERDYLAKPPLSAQNTRQICADNRKTHTGKNCTKGEHFSSPTEKANMLLGKQSNISDLSTLGDQKISTDIKDTIPNVAQGGSDTKLDTFMSDCHIKKEERLNIFDQIHLWEGMVDGISQTKKEIPSDFDKLDNCSNKSTTPEKYADIDTDLDSQKDGLEGNYHPLGLRKVMKHDESIADMYQKDKDEMGLAISDIDLVKDFRDHNLPVEVELLDIASVQGSWSWEGEEDQNTRPANKHCTGVYHNSARTSDDVNILKLLTTVDLEANSLPLHAPLIA